MEITTQEFKHCDLITIKGRVDSSTAPQVAQALEAANESGKYKLVVDISALEYMSSAGFRALLGAQRNSKKYNRGEVVLVNVPDPGDFQLSTLPYARLLAAGDDPLEAAVQVRLKVNRAEQRFR